MPAANPIFSSLGTTIFETMSRLAQAHGSINLGQGFPEGLEPRPVIERLAELVLSGPHQYPSMMGTASLRAAVAAHERHYWGADVAPEQVMVTSGATEALGACLLAMVEPGDEVVVLEPLYDSYLPIIRSAGGIPRIVRLSPPDWSLPREDLAQAFGPRTKAIIINSPANPCGKVWSRDELAFIAALLEKHDAWAICDEVYEHLTYDGRRHQPLMTLPGMAGRCAKIGSAGKIFSLTGWKIGWVVAAPEVLTPIAKAHQFVTFSTAPMLQEAVAWGLDNQRPYIDSLPAILEKRRDRLGEGLTSVGFKVLPTGGSYFLTADYTGLGIDAADDAAFCRLITEQAGVTAIPVSAFYASSPPRGYARFCFAKTDAAIDEAVSRLRRWREK